MDALDQLHRAVDRIGNWSGVRRLRQAAFDRRFETDRRAHLFRGVFGSFDDALRSAPAALPTSYDNEAASSLYLRRLHIDHYDHPAMFWLLRSFDEGHRSVVDVGGSVGVKFFAFGRLMPFPPGLTWRVIDMPAVAERGRAFAAEKGAPAGLEFSDRITDADGIDVFFASGSLQYLPQSLAEILAGLRARPRRIVVNTTPIHATESFFTLNSIGIAYCPYRVQAYQAFVDGVCAQGYVLRDSWLNLGKSMRIPFHAGHDVPDYSGFCFDRVEA